METAHLHKTIAKNRDKIYRGFQNNRDFKVGDTVLVTRKITIDEESLWPGNWVNEMDDLIDHSCTITSITPVGIVIAKYAPNLVRYTFPYFVLDKIDNIEKETINVPDNHCMWIPTLHINKESQFTDTEEKQELSDPGYIRRYYQEIMAIIKLQDIEGWFLTHEDNAKIGNEIKVTAKISKTLSNDVIIKDAYCETNENIFPIEGVVVAKLPYTAEIWEKINN